jgi:demethylmenaquinone methyltransferase/2-methoxy-6-polyprenyl-1,4-benzoquinol methylase
MFARIAPRYDLLNRLLSVGIDRRWRRHLLEHLGRVRGGDVHGALVIDSCCGTGDLALALERHGARVVGVDFTPEMLVRARRKRRGTGGLFVGGDALRLPVRSRAADAASIAFGIRNVADRRQGLRELVRVVRPGGHVLVLEFSLPRGALLGRLYRAYFTRVLPAIGGWISGDARAYRYLPETVLLWPSPEELQREMEALGLVECGFHLLHGGIACLSFGRVPGSDRRGEHGAR